jgi:hypothetical protein
MLMCTGLPYLFTSMNSRVSGEFYQVAQCDIKLETMRKSMFLRGSIFPTLNIPSIHYFCLSKIPI